MGISVTSSYGIGVRRLRKRQRPRPWSQREVAERAGLNPGYIAKLEAGTIREPGSYYLEKIAAAFGLTVDQFLADAGIASSDTLRIAGDSSSDAIEIRQAVAALARIPQPHADDLRTALWTILGLIVDAESAFHERSLGDANILHDARSRRRARMAATAGESAIPLRVVG